MSYSIDVNILLYASDTKSPFHAPARAFLESCASGTEISCLAWPTIMGYLRISTHPSIFASPLSPEDAQKNVESLLALPHVRLIAEEEGFWAVYREVSRGLAARGNTVPDVHLAALLRQHGIRVLYTHDAGFRRFDFLEVRNPLASPLK